MEARDVGSAAAFLAATATLRSRDPVMTNQLASIATGAVAGSVLEGGLWLTVVDQGMVVGCAVHTADRPAVLSPMDMEAAAAVGRFLAANAPDVRAVAGPPDVARAVAVATGSTPVPRMREVVRVLSTLSALTSVCSGEARLAALADLDLLLRWFAEFNVEARTPGPAAPAVVSAAVGEGRVWLWQHATGTAVAMGGHARVVASPGGTVGRIGPVYTMPAVRRHGYGAAITHAVARKLSAECDEVMLMTDADNPDSNSVYDKLGFTVAGEIVEMTFE
jgi:predicted GNAT family acetyltransferase